MSDIFKEVDEDIRREQMRRIWDRVAPFIIGGAVLIVAATAGFRGWEYWQERQAQSSGDRFLAALQLSEDGQFDESIAQLEALVADGSGGYPILARFRIASEKVTAGDAAGALAEFDAIASSNAPAEVRALARLRAALMMVDDAQLADMEALVGDLAATGNPWRHTAREILALTAWRVGDNATAKRYVDSITQDQEAPQDVRQRIAILDAIIEARLGSQGAAIDQTEIVED